MIAKLVLVATLLVGTAFGRLGPGLQGPGSKGKCSEPGKASNTAASTAARGAGLAVADRGRTLFTVSSSGERGPLGCAEAGGLVRHVASRPGLGTVYVHDVAGPDLLVVMRPQGVQRIRGSGELSHPAWSPGGALAWAVDAAMLEVRSPNIGSRRLVPPPRGASAVFSPVFSGNRQLVAVVQEPSVDTHDDDLNDLWRFDLDSARWTRLTRFTAGGDRWSVIRTPIVSPDGSVLFVRIHGRASATKLPSFELWALRNGVASKVRDLAGEMFLAGFLDGRLVWNLFDAAAGVWRLVADGPNGSKDLGRGAVSVDPRTELDPDLLAGRGVSHHSAGGETSDVLPENPGAGLALLLGDFASQAEAAVVAAQLRAPGGMVVDHAVAPLAIAPGAWAVVWPLPAAAQPDVALDGLRALRPDLADRMWVVPFAGRGAGAP